MTAITVLFVDDDPNILSSLRRRLIKETYQQRYASGAKRALEIMAQEPVQVVVSDLRMPETDGLALLSQVKDLYPDTVRLVLSGTVVVPQVVAAINAGEIYRYALKPIMPEELRQTINAAIEHYHLSQARVVLSRLLSERNHELEVSMAERLQVEKQLQAARLAELEALTQIEATLLRGELPQQLKGVQISLLSIASQQMDGDFFEFVAFSARCFDLIIGDVMGNGMRAALTGAGLKAHFLKVLARHMFSAFSGGVPQPDVVVSEVSAEVSARLITLETFVTVCYSRIDLDLGQILFVDCGHTKTLKYDLATDSCKLLEGSNLPLGVIVDDQYQVFSEPLAPGDVLLFYSDGVTEAASRSGELFEVERLQRFLLANHSLAPEELTAKLHHEVLSFAERKSVADDFTSICVKITLAG